MKLGVRAHDYGRHSADRLAEILQGEGFQTVQLAVPKAIAGIDSYEAITKGEIDGIAEAFSERQIGIEVLGCYIDISCGDRAVRDQHLERFYQALSCGARLSAKMVGTESSYGILGMEDKKKTWGMVLDGVSRMTEWAEACGIDVGIEPVAAHTLYSAEWTRKLLDYVGSSRLKVIFDPVNLLTPDRIERQEELWDTCFEAFGNEIEVVHLKDFTVDADGMFRPCLLGVGLMRYGRLFDWLHRNKPNIGVLREEMNPETAKQDIAFMRMLTGQ